MSTPYRAGGPSASRCVACGAERLPDARVCVQCGEEVAAVRCVGCMTLNPVGDVTCVQCGAELAPEPEAVATALLCPRGCGALAAIGDVAECERCGGIFVSNEALAQIVTEHRPKEGERRASIVPPTPGADVVVYRPCPSCNGRMNRTVFGKSSGVIVDACHTHGTWFDARELTASLAFVERGGLALVEKRERERKAEEARRAVTERRTRAFDALSRPMGSRFSDPDRAERDQGLRDLLDVLLSL